MLAGRLLRLRLFNHVQRVEQARILGSLNAVEAAVRGDGRALDDLRGEDGGLRLLESLHHLLEARNLRIDEIVGEDDGEWLVADELFGLQDSVAETERIGLTCVTDLGE